MASERSQAEVLYQILPALYRQRDNGDLRDYCEAAGQLLDRIDATLVQRLADNFPDNPLDGSSACQEWLIPYFADLLDVRLVSPLAEGRRDEVANAVRWRQGKGTLQVAEEIAQAVGRLEVVLHEGWRRVAVTPRLDMPRLPARSFGYAQELPEAPPSLAARHPGLPAVTVDFRCPGGAVAAAVSNPAAQQSNIDGDTRSWRQSGHHGAPCQPDSYQDSSLRSVDFRTPDWHRGHYHPDRILLYTLPPAGRFDPSAETVAWSEDPDTAFLQRIEVIAGDNSTTFRNRSWGGDDFVPVNISGVILLGQEADGVGDADYHRWIFQGVNLLDMLQADSGRIELRDCAAMRVEVHSIDYERPVVSARGCLINDLQAARGVSQLEYCTVLDSTLSEILYASETIFLGTIRKHHLPLAAPDIGCLRYCRIRHDQSLGGMRMVRSTRAAPVFYSTHFGRRGCGVLHPATPAAIRHGAEDGGEMGVHHDDHPGLLAEAVAEKLKDFLPLGMEAVVIPDPTLLEMPG